MLQSEMMYRLRSRFEYQYLRDFFIQFSTTITTILLYPKYSRLWIKSPINSNLVVFPPEAVGCFYFIRDLKILYPAQTIMPIMANQIGFNAQFYKPFLKCTPYFYIEYFPILE